MKTPLSPALQSALAEVAGIADNLADNSPPWGLPGVPDMDVCGVLDNLEYVASCLTLTELADAPAMLNAAARAFLQTYPCCSLGWEHAGRLQTIASTIAAALPVAE